MQTLWNVKLLYFLMVLYHLFLKIYRLVGTLQLGCPCIALGISTDLGEYKCTTGPHSTFSNSIKERPEKTYQQGPCWGRGYKEGSPCELEVKN